MRNAITYAISMIITSVLGKCPILVLVFITNSCKKDKKFWNVQNLRFPDRGSYAEELSRLHGALLSEYNPKLPTITMRVINSSTPSTSASLPKFNVSLTLAYLKLTQVIEPQQRVEFVFQYFLEWRDERLSWNATEYCGIQYLYFSASDVWIPEVTVVDAQTEDIREEVTRFVRVNSAGHANTFIPVITATLCAIDVHKFPFDKQECPIKVLSQAFSANEYNIDIGVSPEVGSDTMPFENMGNGEWELRNVTMYVEVHDSDMEQLSYKMFYITMVILPSFVINILSIFGVFLKSADTMGKLGMALTNIMSLTFILGILATALPKTKGLPRIAIYVMVNLFIMVVALLATVILPYVNRFVGNRNGVSEKSSEKRKLRDKRMSWIIGYGMIALIELANLINFIVLVG